MENGANYCINNDVTATLNHSNLNVQLLLLVILITSSSSSLRYFYFLLLLMELINSLLLQGRFKPRRHVKIEEIVWRKLNEMLTSA